jgi:serine/threonine protein phosphatase 1
MIWIVGDIHGCYNTLRKLLDRVGTADENPQYVFVGDYVDRGIHNRKVVSLVCELKRKGAICLRGNHDNVVDWLLNEECSGDLSEYVRGHVCYDSVMSWWLQNGFAPTLKSYDVEPLPALAGPYGGQTWGGVVMKFREAVPQDHKDFFRSLEMHWSSDTHFACHAFYPPEQEFPPSSLSDEMIHNMLWERFRPDFTSGSFAPPTDIKWDKIGVFGHTPTFYYKATAPIRFSKIRLIDCGAFNDGYLCAYCCETDNWILQATDKADLN